MYQNISLYQWHNKNDEDFEMVGDMCLKCMIMDNNSVKFLINPFMDELKYNDANGDRTVDIDLRQTDDVVNLSFTNEANKNATKSIQGTQYQFSLLNISSESINNVSQFVAEISVSTGTDEMEE